MNPFVSRINRGSWEIPVSLVTLLLGVMISLAWINETNKSSRLNSLPFDQQVRIGSSDPELQKQLQQLQYTVGRLRVENTRLENAVAEGSKSSRVINQSLQELKLFAGLTDVEGPGLAVTLSDSRKPQQDTVAGIIHDVDVLRVVNELWASGAQAITVNNHRASVGSFYRCAGPVLYVDGAAVASPVVIRAIGDADTLAGGLNLPGGALAELRQTDPAMVQLDKVKKFHFPAYTGPTEKPLLTVPQESK